MRLTRDFDRKILESDRKYQDLYDELIELKVENAMQNLMLEVNDE